MRSEAKYNFEKEIGNQSCDHCRVNLDIYRHLVVSILQMYLAVLLSVNTLTRQDKILMNTTKENNFISKTNI